MPDMSHTKSAVGGCRVRNVNGLPQLACGRLPVCKDITNPCIVFLRIVVKLVSIGRVEKVISGARLSVGCHAMLDDGRR
jgi:hypothetical protein